MLLKPKSSLAAGSTSRRRASHSPAQLHICRSLNHPASAVQQPEQAGSTSVSGADADHTQEQPSTSGRLHDTAVQQAAAAGGSLVTFSEMQEIAAARGMHLALKTLGPFYRITCRDGKQGFALTPWFVGARGLSSRSLGWKHGAAHAAAPDAALVRNAFAGGAEGRILGVTNGFVAPMFGLIHCDTLQIFTKG